MRWQSYSDIVYTRDEKIPLTHDDISMLHGWRCIPVPPDERGIWVIADSTHDRKTGWRRADAIAEAAPAVAPIARSRIPS
jgi:hypothetical protein